MIIQFLLTLGLGGCLLYGLATRTEARIVGWAMTLACIVGLYFVWAPNHATRLANILGVGRGTDLIVYCWVVISMSIIVNIHLRLRKQLALITELARHIALQSPKHPEQFDLVILAEGAGQNASNATPLASR